MIQKVKLKKLLNQSCYYNLLTIFQQKSSYKFQERDTYNFTHTRSFLIRKAEFFFINTKNNYKRL